MSTSKLNTSDFEYALGYLKDHDYDRYLIVRLIHDDKIASAFAVIYCLNAEIEKTRWIVSDTTIGLIRLQWWRDTLSEIYSADKRVKDHPTAQLLSHVIQDFSIPEALLVALIEARELDLYPSNIKTTEDYAKIVEQQVQPLAKLITEYICPNQGYSVEAITQCLSAYELSKFALKSSKYLHGAFALQFNQEVANVLQNMARDYLKKAEGTDSKTLPEIVFTRDNLRYAPNSQSLEGLSIDRKPLRLLKLLFWHYLKSS